MRPCTYEHMPWWPLKWRFGLFVSGVLEVLVNHLEKLLADVWRSLSILFGSHMIILVEGVVDFGCFGGLSKLLELSHFVLRTLNGLGEVELKELQ